MIIFAFLALGLVGYNSYDKPETRTTKEIYEQMKRDKK
jgi:hypothetical protein